MSATITQPYIATYTPPLSDIRFEGYYFTGTDVASKQCQNTFDSFKIDGTYAFCCPTLSNIACRSATTCSGSTRIGVNGEQYPCGSGQRCGPFEFYENYPDSKDGWSATAWWCLEQSEPSTVYQNMKIPLVTTITTDITTTSTTLESTTGTRAPATTTSPDLSEQTTGGDDAGGNNSGLGTNVGAIAGGVVGGVAGLALILALGWFLLRRRRTKQSEISEIGDMVEQTI